MQNTHPLIERWSKLGFSVRDLNLTSSRDVIEAAKLDWQVEKRKIYYANPSGTMEVLPEHEAIMRINHPNYSEMPSYTPLGVVGSRYTPVQNVDSFDFTDRFVQEGLMTYEAAGHFKGGRKIWILGKLNSFDVVPGDTVEQYILFYNSHDGSSALCAALTNLRLFCTNIIKFLIKSAKSDKRKGIFYKHTTGIISRLEDNTQMLQVAREMLGAQKNVMQDMAKKTLSDAKWQDFTRVVFKDPPESKEHLLPRIQEQRDLLTKLFYKGTGQDVPGIQNTVWAGVNAITEYATHHKRVRGDNKDERRVESALIGLNSTWIEKHVELLLAA